MLSFEEAGYVLDELIEELPEEIFKNLNGGVNLIEEAKKSEDGRYTMGTYFRGTLGRYVELYYGSFVELYGSMDDELFRTRLKKTLHHELTHHIESMAGDRSLERWDERQSELYGFNGIDVHSILFVDDDNSALGLAAEAVFNANKVNICPDVTAFSAAAGEAAESINEKAAKVCGDLGVELAKRAPCAVTRELLEKFDVALCMTIDQADALSCKYQDLDERIMCLAEDDIRPPALPIGWKKCILRLQDEVLAVIDELSEEFI